MAWIALLLSRGPGTGLRWRQALPGAALAALGWALITVGFDVYLQLSSGANPLFRSLGSVIVALYWLYLLIIALLIGGAFNAVRTRSGHAGSGPGRRIAPPVRARARRSDDEASI